MIDWVWFVPAALLLLFPAEGLLPARASGRAFEEFQTLEDAPLATRWWGVLALWLDPLRGFGGAWVLALAIGLRPGFQDHNSVGYYLFVAVICAGVAAQTFARGTREAVLAPVGFVGGIALALAPLTVSLLALTAAVASLFALRRFAAFFAAGAAALLILGLAFKMPLHVLIPTVVAFLLPLVIGFLSGKPLELPTRVAVKPLLPLHR